MSRIEWDNAVVVFVTEHERMGIDASRYVFRLAHSMTAAGYRTAVINAGAGLVRPDWLFPPYLSVQGPDDIRLLLTRQPRRITIGMTTGTVWFAASDSAEHAMSTYQLVDRVESVKPGHPMDVPLFARGLRVSPVLTCSPWIRDMLAGLGVPGSTLLPVAIDDALFGVAARTADPRAVLCHCAVEHPRADVLVAGSFQAAERKRDGLRLTAMGFSPVPAPLARRPYRALAWHDEDAHQRAAAFSEAGCFVWTRSDSELPVPVLEAMAAGRAVVAMRSHAVDAFCTDGVDSLLVAAGDTQGMADAIVRLIDDEDLRAGLIEGARETVSGYRWESLLEALPGEIRTERRPDRGHGIGAIKWDI